MVEIASYYLVEGVALLVAPERIVGVPFLLMIQERPLQEARSMAEAKMGKTQVIHRDIHIGQYETDLAAWMSKGMSKAGKLNQELAKLLGVGPSEISKMKAGRRKVFAAQLFIIATYIEEPIPSPKDYLSSLPRSVPILGEAGRPFWYDVDPVIQVDLTLQLIPSDKFRDLPHFATRVFGHSVNLFIPDGMYAIYVPYWETRKVITDKDFVLFKHVRDDGKLHKRLIRQVSALPTRHELRCASTDERQNAERLRLSADLKFFEGTHDRFEPVGLIVWQCGQIGV